MPLPQIQVVAGSAAPIYRQIIDQVRLAVATGAAREGEVVPSVRALAERLVVNPNTVARAYADLVRDGVLESQPGRGMFIAPRRKVFTEAERCRRLEPLLEALLNEAVCLDFSVPEIRALLEEKLSALSSRHDRSGEKAHD